MYSYAAYVLIIFLLCTHTRRMLKQYAYYVLTRHVCWNNMSIMYSYVTYVLIIFLLCTHTQRMLYKYVFSKQVHCLRTCISFAERRFSKKHIKKGRLINDETTYAFSVAQRRLVVNNSITSYHIYKEESGCSSSKNTCRNTLLSVVAHWHSFRQAALDLHH